ncbi:SpoIIE family protein phosphatase [Desulfobacterales bacterium HSG17]|nr:SpoIIE family protein phosphatase [Desulfobacterales bacterium HSG17]
MNNYNKKILVIDDDPGVRDAYHEILAKKTRTSDIIDKGAMLFGHAGQTPVKTNETHYDLALADCGEQGIEQVTAAAEQNQHFAVAFVDMKMPGLNGAETSKRIWGIDPDIKIIIVTAFSEFTPDDIIKITERDDIFYLRKPFNSEEIKQFARALTNQWNIEREKNLLSDELNSANRQLMKYAKDLAHTNKSLNNANNELALAHEQEISTASEIQKALLTGHPPNDLKGIEIAQMTIPSQRVDGDFYDFFQMSDNCLDIIIGDVMGKGVPAALLGAATKSHLLHVLNEQIRITAKEEYPEPASIISETNRRMISQLERLETFTTLCYARFDLEKNKFSFIDCGHMRTICLHTKTRTISLHQGVNMPLGFPQADPFQIESLTFEHGDLFFFYSDGLTEAKNPDGKMFGEKRLLDLILQKADNSPKELAENIYKAILDFAQGDNFNDDFTCIAVRID